MFLPWVEKELEKIRTLNLNNESKLDLLFKNVPGICRFKTAQLTKEQQEHFLKYFKLKPSLKNFKRKLNRRK